PMLSLGRRERSRPTHHKRPPETPFRRGSPRPASAAVIRLCRRLLRLHRLRKSTFHRPRSTTKRPTRPLECATSIRGGSRSQSRRGGWKYLAVTATTLDRSFR